MLIADMSFKVSIAQIQSQSFLSIFKVTRLDFIVLGPRLSPQNYPFGLLHASPCESSHQGENQANHGDRYYGNGSCGGGRTSGFRVSGLCVLLNCIVASSRSSCLTRVAVLVCVKERVFLKDTHSLLSVFFLISEI